MRLIDRPAIAPEYFRTVRPDVTRDDIANKPQATPSLRPSALDDQIERLTNAVT